MGGVRGPRPGARHGPVLRRLLERARFLPRLDGPLPRSIRAPAAPTRSIFPRSRSRTWSRRSAFLSGASESSKLHAAVGSSMGGIQSLAYAAFFRTRSPPVVCDFGRRALAPGRSRSASSSGRPSWPTRTGTGETTTAGEEPLNGMHAARQLGTISYRGPGEWEPRFGREQGRKPPVCRQSRGRSRPPAPLRRRFPGGRTSRTKGDKFARSYDANWYLLVSKAMDLFDLGGGEPSFEEGVRRIRARSLIVGVPTDLLFPIRLQEEIAATLAAQGRDVSYRVLDSVHGLDSFLDGGRGAHPDAPRVPERGRPLRGAPRGRARGRAVPGPARGAPRPAERV